MNIHDNIMIYNFTFCLVKGGLSTSDVDADSAFASPVQGNQRGIPDTS